MTPSRSTERTLAAIRCLLLGHNWVGHTAYKLETDTGRAMYGDLCQTCGRFQPRTDGKERFDNPLPTSFAEAVEANPRSFGTTENTHQANAEPGDNE